MTSNLYNKFEDESLIGCPLTWGHQIAEPKSEYYLHYLLLKTELLIIFIRIGSKNFEKVRNFGNA